MSRLSLALVLVVGILAGGVGTYLLQRGGPTPLADQDVRGIVTEMLAAERASSTELDPKEVNALIEAYLMGDPGILQRMSNKLAAAKRVEAREAQKELIDLHHAAIYEDPADVVLGNPNGDVTLVEMFDYNCGYCRQALPDIATLLKEDPNLKLILKEFPILSAGSIEAARVAALVNEDKSLDYWAFHQELFSKRGQIGAEQALDAAASVGANRVALMIDMNGKAAEEAVERGYRLASALDVTGTPTFIIGDELIPGAIGLAALREKIANMRACGSTVCTTDG